MSNLVVMNLSMSNELDHRAMADVNGGFNNGIKSSSSYPQDQEPELGVSGQLSTFGWLQNQPFTPHS